MKRRFKKNFAALLTVTLITLLSIGAMPLTTLITADAAGLEFDGSGSQSDPFKIISIEDLYQTVNASCAYYILLRDLDFNDNSSYENPSDTSFGDINGDGTVEGIKAEATSSTGWPCGVFTGHLDGNKHSIYNLYQNSTIGGLYYSLDWGSSIKNLGIIDANITKGNGACGVLASESRTTTIDRVVVTGTITDTSVDPNGRNNGGLIGKAGDGANTANLTIDDCYSDVTINASSNEVGGFVGFTHLSNVYVNRSLAKGDIIGANGTGGIFGTTVSNIEVTDCIAFMNNINNPSVARRIAGNVVSSYTMINNYAYADMNFAGSTKHSTDASSLDGKDLSTADFKDSSFYAANLPNWDFNNTWEMTSEGPILKGFSDNALHMTGTGQHVNVPDSASLDISGNEITLEGWINIDNMSGYTFPEAYRTVVSKNRFNGYALIYERSQLVYLYTDASVEGVNAHEFGVRIPDDLIVGAWHHIAGVYDGSTQKIYFDGKLIGQRNYSGDNGGNLMPNDTALQIGSDCELTTMEGAVDEVRVWNVARSASQISENMYSELNGDETGLVAYYDFNEQNGNTVFDKTSNGNHGTFNGATRVRSGAKIPTGVSTVERTTNSLTFSVVEDSNTESYIVQIDDNIDFSSPSNFKVVTDENADARIFEGTISGLSFNERQNYYYRIASIASNEMSDYSNAKLFVIQPSKALDFDGTNDYVFLGNSSHFRGLSKVTVEAWVRSQASSAYQTVFVKTNDDTAANALINLSLENGTTIYTSVNNVDGGDSSVIKAPNAISLNEWNHVAFSWDSSDGGVIIYVNGTQVASGTSSTSPIASAGNGLANIGTMIDGNIELFDGQIDELRVWSDVRTASEIQNHMYSELNGDETGLVAYYDFNDGIGDTLTDKTSNRNFGTLTNMDGSDWVMSQCFNHRPTDIALSSSNVEENQPSGTAVGTLSTTDTEGDAHTYSLVLGTGDTDNASFTIDGETLKTGAIFDFEIKSTYSIRIKAQNSGINSFEKAFTVNVDDLRDVVSIDSGSDNTILSYDNGDNYVWGNNDSGVFGYLPSSAFSANVMKIPDNTGTRFVNQDYIHVASYYGGYALATKSDGSVWTWGTQFYGRLGTGEGNKSTDSPVPEKIDILNGKNIIKTEALNESAIALDNQGDVYAWGYEYFADGDGIYSDTICYTLKEISFFEDINVIDIVAGMRSAAALDDQGNLYTWGYDYYSETGRTSDYGMPAILMSNVADMTMNTHSGAAITNSGELWVWGQNASGQFGLGNSIEQQTPVKVTIPDGKSVSDVVLGNGTMFILTDDGDVYGAGSNSNGQLGLGSGAGSFLSLQKIDALDTKVITNIYTDANHTFALADDGTLYGWGYNGKAQLGDDSLQNKLSPVVMDMVPAGFVQLVSSGDATYYIDSNGAISVIGSNSDGQFGDGLKPISRIPGKSNIPAFAKIDYDVSHAVGLKSDGTVWTWGINNSGQLGTGNTLKCSSTPGKVGGLLSGKTIVDISACNSTTIVLDGDGNMYGWGSTGYGRLGNLSSSQFEPVVVPRGDIPSGEKIVNVEVGNLHSMALTDAGKVYVWGYDRYGCLGTDSVANEATVYAPVLMDHSGFITAKTIEAGSADSVVIASDGTVWTTGYITGDPIYQQHDKPYQVLYSGSPISGVTKALYGSDDLSVLTESGDLYTMGANNNGSAGNGQTHIPGDSSTNQRAPYLALTGVQHMSVGYNFTIAVKNDQTVWGWGKNNLGQIGNGQSKNVLVPTQIEFNRAPTDITITSTSVDERLPIGDVIANFGTVDPDTGDSFVYTFISGEGDTDNSCFTIDRFMLKVKNVMNFDTKQSYSIRVKSADAGGLSTEKSFIISVNDTTPEKPVIVSIDGDTDGTVQTTDTTPEIVINNLFIGDKLILFKDGTLFDTRTVTGETETFDLTALDVGTWTITARAEDATSHKSPASSSISLEILATAMSPVINTQPADTYVLAGQTATISVISVSGDGGTLSYQWQKSMDKGSSWSNIAGATSSTYTTGTIELSDGEWLFRCVVTNTLNGTTDSVNSDPAAVAAIDATGDTDGDGVSDGDEVAAGSSPHDPSSTPSDTDGDGNPDDPNADTDGDGVSDGDEAAAGSNPNNASSTPCDKNGDGVVDDATADTDGDGVSDGDEAAAGSDPNDSNSTPSDKDGDGQLDNADSDSDGDGVSDGKEAAAGSDPDDANSTPADTDGDGAVDDPTADTDGDGISDGDEAAAGSDPNNASSTPCDKNGDGIMDDANADTDGDGVSDGDEVTAGSDPNNSDSTPSDKDGDGQLDNADSDSDGDGVSDGDEVAAGSNPNDASSTPSDKDGDGTVDDTTADTDGDGVSDGDEVAAGSDPNDASSTPSDKDGDGIVDDTTADSDGDGVSDGKEAAAGSDPDDARSTPADKDGDGTVDDTTADSDGDGVSDGDEVAAGSDPDDARSTPADKDGDGTVDDTTADSDGDGVRDGDEVAAGSNPNDASSTPSDKDGDGTVDDTTADTDGDGVSDGDEAAAGSDPNDASSKPAKKQNTDDTTEDETYDPTADSDGDGISDADEIAAGSDPDDAKSTPSDKDADGNLDSPTADSDGDGISDADEVAAGSDPDNASSTPSDKDGDGNLDSPTADSDGDGVSDADEVAAGSDPDNAKSTPSDKDGDGKVDHPTADSDGDGISDEDEIAAGSNPDDASSTPSDKDGDGTIDNPNADSDGDIASDGFEVEVGSDPDNPMSTPADKDGDGQLDNPDTDTDGDGITDEEEVLAGTNPNDADSKQEEAEQDAGNDSNHPITLRGVLVDQDDEPVSNMTIELHSKVQKVVTNDLGEFELRNVSIGSHELYVINEQGSELVSLNLNITNSKDQPVSVDWHEDSNGALAFNINDNVIALETTLSLDESIPLQSTQIVYENNLWETVSMWLIIGAGSIIVIGLLVLIILKKKQKNDE